VSRNFTANILVIYVIGNVFLVENPTQTNIFLELLVKSLLEYYNTWHFLYLIFDFMKTISCYIQVIQNEKHQWILLRKKLLHYKINHSSYIFYIALPSHELLKMIAYIITQHFQWYRLIFIRTNTSALSQFRFKTRWHWF